MHNRNSTYSIEKGAMANNNRLVIIAVGVSVVAAFVALVMAIIVLTKAPPPPAAPIFPSTIPTKGPSISTGRQMITSIFARSMNLSADPCNDFYQYSCGNWIQNHPIPSDTSRLISFSILNKKITQQLVGSLNNLPSNYANVKSMQQAKMAYSSCVKAPNSNFVGKEVLGTFNKYGGMPLLVGNSWTMPAGTTVEKIIGEFSSQYGIAFLASWNVDTDWKHDSQQMLWLNQPSFSLPDIYYTTNATWTQYRPRRVKYTKSVIMALANVANSTLSSTEAQTFVEKMLDAEHILAKMNIPAAKLRNFTQQYNVFTITRLNSKWSSVKWNDLISGITGNKYTVTKIGVLEPGVFDSLISTANVLPLINNETTLVNYLMWRYAQSVATEFIRTSEVLESHMKFLKETDELTTIPERQSTCALTMRSYFAYPVSRLYVDEWIQSNPRGRTQVGGMISTILSAFASNMIPKLPWMDDQTKQLALWKANQLAQNVAYPDWMMNNTALDMVYSANVINISSSEDYYSIVLKLNAMVTALSLSQLRNPTDRHNFLGAPAVVNAWYQPELNSITFPAGILNSPFYRSDFPMAVNYGGMGVVMGHELSHGFDDEGVQWNANGTLMDWMDSYSNQGFQTNVAKCIQDEYSGFCYPPSMGLNPNCISGDRTQGENIADNGGIKAAYAAYELYVKLNGPEQPLPAPMDTFSMEQLFFLSFAQVWCEHSGHKTLQRQLLIDPHSPGKYRVLGTVRNFDAFARAFNCPANSNMNPSTHCNIW